MKGLEAVRTYVRVRLSAPMCANISNVSRRGFSLKHFTRGYFEREFPIELVSWRIASVGLQKRRT